MHDDVSFLIPSQLAEHGEFADQSDHVGHGQVLQSNTLVRNGKPLLSLFIKQNTVIYFVLFAHFRKIVLKHLK